MAETTSFYETVKQIKNNICVHGVYVPYIKFTVLNTQYGDISFTTDNSGTGSSICCVTHLENNKNGSGYANSFSITISFSPSKTGLFYSSVVSEKTLDFTNVNLIDDLLNLNKKAGAQTKCTLQYGYSYPIHLLSPTYEGTILDYHVEVLNGILNYTITGYSSIAMEFKDNLISIEGTGSNKKKPTDMAQEIFDTYIKDESDYVLEWEADTKGTDKEIEIDTISNVSPVEAMKILIEQYTEYSGDNEDTELESRSSYHILISDVLNKDNKKTIKIVRYDPTAKQDKKNSTDTVRFSWMGAASGDSMDYAANAMVIDFRADFKGSVTMGYDYSTLIQKINKMGIDSAGNKINTYGNNTPVAGSNTSNDNVSNLNLWVSRLQYSYGATLVVIGIPYEVQILENIYVAPMILGQEHHTGGLYKITKITDVIDASGFITTFELFKNKGEDTATRAAKRRRQELLDQKANRPNGYTIQSSSDGYKELELNREIDLLNELIGDGGVD